MYCSPSTQRSLIWLSIVAGAVFGLGFFLTGFIPLPPPTLDADAVAALYSTDNLQLRVGVVLCLIGGFFNIPWSVAVSLQLAREEKGAPAWAILQACGGAVGSILFVLPALFWGVAAFSVDRDPELTKLMHELAMLTLITPVTFFVLQALPIVAVAFKPKADTLSAFPRWVGYFTAWLLAAAELGVMAQLFRTGPFAWNGLFAFWLPFSLFGVWFGVLDVLMLRAISRQQSAAMSEPRHGG